MPDMKQPIDITFPDAKISASFLDFAEPILSREDDALTTAETEKCLSVAFVVWNAVVYDTVHGNTQWVTRLREQIAHDVPLSALIEGLIARKQTLFGHDLRLVGNYKIVEKNGEWRLRVEARSPTEKGRLPDLARHVQTLKRDCHSGSFMSTDRPVTALQNADICFMEEARSIQRSAQARSSRVVDWGRSFSSPRTPVMPGCSIRKTTRPAAWRATGSCLRFPFGKRPPSSQSSGRRIIASKTMPLCGRSSQRVGADDSGLSGEGNREDRACTHPGIRLARRAGTLEHRPQRTLPLRQRPQVQKVLSARR